MKYTFKLRNSSPASFHTLDPEKAIRLNAKTMYVASVQDVQEMILAIPFGQTLSTDQIRDALAIKGGADTACPVKVNSYWRWLAYAHEEEGGDPLPWWRVTFHGKLSAQLPGGIDEHRNRLMAEGVEL